MVNLWQFHTIQHNTGQRRQGWKRDFSEYIYYAFFTLES